MAELRKNRAKHKIHNGECAFIAMGYMNPELIEFLAQFGFDGAWIETEHGPGSFEDIQNMTRACDVWGISSVVRVNLNDYGWVYRTLDMGAQSIVIPHVNTAQEAKDFVHAAKFKPIGLRGMYTSRQGLGVKDYFQKANDETLLCILIEDIVGLNNLPEILKVDNIDVFFIANGDLAQSMGYIGQNNHPEVLAAADRGYKMIRDAGRIAGALVVDSNVETYIKKGVKFFAVPWTPWVESGAKNFLEKASRAEKSLKG
ncbi:MAG: hypothetical protein FJ319_12865 [SAR202 cluster bacterium]|nr:hypothetical protein [SAR202 cluster bacterium]